MRPKGQIFPLQTKRKRPESIGDQSQGEQASRRHLTLGIQFHRQIVCKLADLLVSIAMATTGIKRAATHHSCAIFGASSSSAGAPDRRVMTTEPSIRPGRIDRPSCHVRRMTQVSLHSSTKAAPSAANYCSDTPKLVDCCCCFHSANQKLGQKSVHPLQKAAISAQKSHPFPCFTAGYKENRPSRANLVINSTTSVDVHPHFIKQRSKSGRNANNIRS